MIQVYVVDRCLYNYYNVQNAIPKYHLIFIRLAIEKIHETA